MNQFINYGIDLGTSNSCIACWENNDLRLFQNNDQMNVTPSVVHITPQESLMVGRLAYDKIFTDPENTAYEFKRIMGQKDKVYFKRSDKFVSPEELSSEILKSLLNDVYRLTNNHINAAVITVPAAFGTLQCEATFRAAKLAGIETAVLLQEPIAASIAYGIKPDSENKKWLVFDLGGGTLDVAIISTKNSRLNVLDHRGNNILGGKDIDKIIVNELLIPRLETEFNLPKISNNIYSYTNLLKRLSKIAEKAKIELSSLEKTIVPVFDIGKDIDGNLVETEIIINRKEFEKVIDPLVEKCLESVDEVIQHSKIEYSDIDTIILVGGSTQIPYLRNVLKDKYGINIDYSTDPITIVSKGAAIYASSLENPSFYENINDIDKIAIKIAYENISESLKCPITLKFEDLDKNKISEIKIESDDGYWSSGWITLTKKVFDISVILKEKKTNTFKISARTKQGKLVETIPDKFCIRHGLSFCDPPLPHTIAVEILKTDNKTILDPIFYKGMPLPIEKTLNYKATKTLRPSNISDCLAVKLWEGETFNDPEANGWVGCLLIRAEDIKRPIPEGSDIEITIKVDVSRLITVDVFIPYLNEYFSENIWKPQRDELDYLNSIEKLPEQINLYINRVENLISNINTDDEAKINKLNNLKIKIEDLDIQYSKIKETSDFNDSDQAKQLTENSRKIRASISELESNVFNFNEEPVSIEKLEITAIETEELVEKYGTSYEKKELKLLQIQIERYSQNKDSKSLKKALNSLENLHDRVLLNQDWFWKNAFKYLKEPGQKFLNKNEANRLIKIGNESITVNDIETLQDVVVQLWHLQPQSVAEEIKEKVLKTGLTK